MQRRRGHIQMTPPPLHEPVTAVVYRILNNHNPAAEYISMRYILCTGIISLLAYSGCRDAEPTAKPSGDYRFLVDDTFWELVAFENRPGELSPVGTEALIIGLQDSCRTEGGNNPCIVGTGLPEYKYKGNSFWGPLHLGRGDSLQLGPISQTYVGTIAGSRQGEFVDALDAARTYLLEPARLTILYGSSGALHFHPFGIVDRRLTAGDWKFVSFSSAWGLWRGQANSEHVLRFNRMLPLLDVEARGPRCGAIARITQLGSLSVPDARCFFAESEDAEISRIMDALRTASRYEVKGQNLRIYYDGGKRALNFKRLL
jgi:hypothetical protein